MKLCEKIVELRKSRGMTQEELAEKLEVSRQAVSRWEMGTAMPDASNILQLSRLFGVTTDYLLNDDYVSDADLPPVRHVKEDNTAQIMVYLVTLEVMILLIQFMCTVILQNLPLSFLAFILFIVPIGGFEGAYRRNPPTEKTTQFRLKFYKISAWLGLIFPTFFVGYTLTRLWPRPHSILLPLAVSLVLYIATATLICLALDRAHLKQK